MVIVRGGGDGGRWTQEVSITSAICSFLQSVLFGAMRSEPLWFFWWGWGGIEVVSPIYFCSSKANSYFKAIEMVWSESDSLTDENPDAGLQSSFVQSPTAREGSRACLC